MSKLLQQFANDMEVSKVLKDPEKLQKVLFIIQETTDQYMAEARSKMNDKRRSVQKQAQEALQIATAIIEAEKKMRELELYNTVELQGRGMNVVTDV